MFELTESNGYIVGHPLKLRQLQARESCVTTRLTLPSCGMANSPGVSS